MDSELRIALEQLEQEMEISIPLRMNSNNEKLRYSMIILEIKKRICPKRQQIMQGLKTEGMQLFTVVVDALLSFVTQLPLIAASIAKYICTVGLEKFCQQPMLLIEQKLEKNE